MSAENSCDLEMNILDRQIALTRTTLQGLLRQRNSLTPVSRIPDEVLSEIFLHARDMVYPQGRGNDTDAPMLWRALTGTCLKWNETAVRAPRLWSVIDLNSCTLQWSQIMLARSGKTLLSISVHRVGAKYEEEVLRWVYEVIDRVWSLSLSLDGFISPLTQTILESAHAPKIRYFELSLQHSGRTSNRTAHSLEVLFCRPLINSHLNALYLHNCSIDWASPVLRTPSLRSLEIITRRNADTPTQKHIMAILFRLPNLEHLHLSLWPIDETFKAPAEPVDMKNLRYVGLCGPSAIVRIIRWMRLGIHVHIRLDISEHYCYNHLWDHLSGHILTLSEHGRTPMHSVHFVQHEHMPQVWSRAIHVRVWAAVKDSNSIGDMSHMDTNSPWLEVIIPFRDRGVDNLIKAFTPAFAETEDLWLVGGGAQVSVSSWTQLINHFPALQTLRMVGWLGNVIGALGQETLSNNRMPLPALQDVSLYDAHLQTELIQWLDARQQLGFEVGTISFVRCGYVWGAEEGAAFKDAIHSSVGEVVWYDVSKF